MAQTRRTNRVSTSRNDNRTGYASERRQNDYVYGNVAYDIRTYETTTEGTAARDLSIQRQLEQEPRRKLSNETRKNREKARHMSLGYVLFLMAALCTSAVVLINYIQLQSELTARTENITRLEKQLNSAKLTNDEAYNRITRNVDLEEIKRVAIGELGMVYAEEGQIVTYSNVGNDYMRQVNN